ncbi:LysR family transcriptional regulator [Piscinibacter sp. HJYY11]|uniref:LysR family transcriptional regulator n=1 Tax=Piscinibacter sp. HJYY11 TaxID=2801333 RepID=UPI00191EFCCE|nr:LysR family transcriptional regulator [Piscinibacter sp. HJYY11]MBL0729020.1 LysR family transcriptional regulator [Piscinibacter sp. HJYY11]
MDLNALSDFTLVAAHGGFGRASRTGRRSKATLSRRIADLESQLGVRLIERGAKGLELTEAGYLLLSRTEGPMHEVVEALTAVREGTGKPRGLLRIAAPVLFAQLALGRLCAEFRQLHPEVTVEVVSEDRLVDLVEERFDVAIRPNPRPDTALVGRRFARDRLLVVAAPSVPKPRPARQPVPVQAVVMSTREGDTWALEDSRLVLQPLPVLRLSSMLMLRDAALVGAGAALLPQSIVSGHLARGELVNWGAAAGQQVDLWVLHTSRRLASPKVNAFVDFMCARHHPDGPLVLAA